MYQLGFDLQATPSTFWLNRSAAGTPCGRPDELLLLGRTDLPRSTRCRREAARCARPRPRCGRRRRWRGTCPAGSATSPSSSGASARDVDEPGDAIVGSRGGDDGSAVGVADEDGRAADPPERAHDRGDVALERVEAVLGGHHFVPLGLQRGDHLAVSTTRRPRGHGRRRCSACSAGTCSSFRWNRCDRAGASLAASAFS